MRKAEIEIDTKKAQASIAELKAAAEAATWSMNRLALVCARFRDAMDELAASQEGGE